jgi:hypothetical protein
LHKNHSIYNIIEAPYSPNNKTRDQGREIDAARTLALKILSSGSLQWLHHNLQLPSCHKREGAPFGAFSAYVRWSGGRVTPIVAKAMYYFTGGRKWSEYMERGSKHPRSFVTWLMLCDSQLHYPPLKGELPSFTHLTKWILTL